MRTKESLVLSPVYSGAGFLLFPFLQYVICCLQCSFLLKNTTGLVSGSQPNPISLHCSHCWYKNPVLIPEHCRFSVRRVQPSVGQAQPLGS